MSFNLGQFMAKSAAKTDLNTTTEGQLNKAPGKPDNKSNEPSSLTDKQLEVKREGEQTVLAEKQLEAARSKKDAPAVLTEKQLAHDDKEQTVTSEAQLAKDRETHSEAPVEKRLDNVRESGFNLKSFLEKIAKKEKKQDINSTTEGQLGNDNKGPEEVTEKQLDADRKDGDVLTTEARLEKVRTGSATVLTEGQMEDSKSKLMKHRNPDTSKGDINKVEEQRLAAKKTNEKEEYKPASSTDKKLMLPEIKGKDGLKTASSSKTIKTAQFNEPFNIGFMERENLGEEDSDRFSRVSPDMESLLYPRRRIKKNLDEEALAEGASRGIEIPDDSEIAGVAEEDDTGVDAEGNPSDEDNEEVPAKFSEDNIQDVDVGSSKMKQITLTFDPSDFKSEKDVKIEAAGFIVSKYPSLFSFKVGRKPIEVSQSISVMMDDGKAVAMLPAVAFIGKAASAS
jgi:hypothetical protein